MRSLRNVKAIVSVPVLAAAALLGYAGCGGSNASSPGGSDAGASDTGKSADSTRSDVGASDAGPSPDGKVTDSGSSTEVGSDAGGAISAPDDTWTWVDFPGSKCANGSATGLAINPHAGSTDLMFYFEGGGSCHDATTCWGPDPTATFLTGYDASTFAAAKARAYPILNRTQAGNPFSAMNMVYVPYCTGDLHSGTAVVNLTLGDGGTQPTYFYGATDLSVFLERIVPTFPKTTHIWSTGTSAGGFGSYLSFDRIAHAFPSVRVDILDDSGPAIVMKGAANNAGLISVYGYVTPTGCAAPCNSLAEILAYDMGVQATFSPPGRYGFLTFNTDTTIAPDFGYSPTTEYPALMTAFSASLPAAPAAATYIVTNEPPPSHVVESVGALEPDYMPWITQMVTDDPTWADVIYMVP